MHNQVLSQEDFSLKEALLQILSHLLVICTAGDRKIRSTKGLISGFKKITPLPSVFLGWL